MLPALASIINDNNNTDDDANDIDIEHLPNQRPPSPSPPIEQQREETEEKQEVEEETKGKETKKATRNYVSFYLFERLNILSKIEKAGISMTELKDIEDITVRDSVNSVIDPISFESFAAKYHIKGTPTSRQQRKWLNKVRDWAETDELNCTKLNDLTVGKTAKRNGGAGRSKYLT